jgi:predicted Rossmann fold nucleotide-binding protein DprA/Smf involved in DNA uptake
MELMKLLIVGSRSITSFDLSPYVSPEVDTIISGGANGIDSLPEKYADKHRLSKYIIRPEYGLYGRGAPLKRNETMVDLSDEVLVIWDGESRGTKYTIDYCRKRGKPVKIVTPDS